MIENKDKISRYYPILMWALLFGYLLIRFAEPMKDGDVLWHIKYGEHHVQQNSLVVDHSIFSWTPAIKYVPYCTWFADILLFLLFQAGGWPILYAFMYACLFFPIIITGVYARQVGVSSHLATFSILILLQMAVADAAYMKPEILSLVFFGVSAFLYFRMKIDRLNERKNRYFLFYPLIFLIWANTHGVFIFGLLFLASMIAGELINFLIKNKESFPKRSIFTLALAGVLSLAATFITPYGTDLMKQFLGRVTAGGMPQNVVGNILGYQSVLQNIWNSSVEHNFILWLIMLTCIVLLVLANFKKRRELDFGILLPTILLAYIHLKYLRASFYWPPFWAMSVFYLAGKDRVDITSAVKNVKPQLKVGLVVLLIGLFIYYPARSIYHRVYRPIRNNYIGYGFNTAMPVQASAFVKENKVGKKIFNSYNAGSYLIFDLFPDRKVFIDPRYFPYEKNVYDKYMSFRDGDISINEMVSEFGFDTAVITNREIVLNHFIASENWKPVFYGVGGVVLVNDSAAFENDITQLDRHRFDGIKNLVQAATIVRTAQNLNDLDTADYVIDIMEKKFSHLKKNYDFFYSICTLSQKGLRAFEQGDYNTALGVLWKVGFNDSSLRINSALKTLINMHVNTYLKEEKYQQAFTLMARLFNYYKNDEEVMYNAGVIAYIVSKHNVNIVRHYKVPPWRSVFERLLVQNPHHTHADIVKKLLKGEGLSGQPPLFLNFANRIN